MRGRTFVNLSPMNTTVLCRLYLAPSLPWHGWATRNSAVSIRVGGWRTAGYVGIKDGDELANPHLGVVPNRGNGASLTFFRT